MTRGNRPVDDAGSPDFVYALVVRAENEQEALDALATNVDLDPSVPVSVRPTSARCERLLVVELGEADISRRPIERQLIAWMVRDEEDFQADSGFPTGSLLFWRRAGAEDP